MPEEDKAKKEIRKRGGSVRYRTFHPPGRPDVYMRAAIVRKKGPRGGKTVIGKIHHKGESFNLDKYLEKLFEKSNPISSTSIIKSAQKQAREFSDKCFRKCESKTDETEVTKCKNKCLLNGYVFFIKLLQYSISKCSTLSNNKEKCEKKIKLFIEKLKKSMESEKQAMKAW